MPTYLQLQREPEWGAETTPQSVLDLINRLKDHYGLTLFQFGTKGDSAHLSGYHRSRAWVVASRYCTSRSYSATETAGNKKPGNANWVCALDATLPRDELIAACKRLDAAVRAGRLEKVTEWYGNDDGDSRVDGYDNIRNVVASSDSSHLWHLHLSFDRGRANEDHSDVFAILTGGDDVAFKDDADARRMMYRVLAMFADTPTEADGGETNMQHLRFSAIDAKLAELDAAIAAISVGGVDLAAVEAAAEKGAKDGINGATIHAGP